MFKYILVAYLYESRTGPIFKFIIVAYLYETETRTGPIFKCILVAYLYEIKVITKLPNCEQSYKGKVKTHNYINRQNQSTTGKL